MEFDEISNTIQSWDTMLSDRMRRYIHYKSMRNFILHYDEIESDRTRNKITTLLADYVEEVQANDYSFDAQSGADLAYKYVFALAEYYREHSSFMRVVRFQNIFIWGSLFDSILYLTGILSHFWYIPLTISSLFLYYLFIAIFKEPKGRVYGMYY